VSVTYRLAVSIVLTLIATGACAGDNAPAVAVEERSRLSDDEATRVIDDEDPTAVIQTPSASVPDPLALEPQPGAPDSCAQIADSDAVRLVPEVIVSADIDDVEVRRVLIEAASDLRLISDQATPEYSDLLAAASMSLEQLATDLLDTGALREVAAEFFELDRVLGAQCGF